MKNRVWLTLAAAACFLVLARPAAAQTLAPQERLCDPAFEDCRADILKYIAQETVQIDMGYWMMTDARYSNALVAAWNRGVKIRLLMDPRCTSSHPACPAQNDQLATAGIPMRNRLSSGILHWKVIIFAGQGQVEFAGANYAPFELTPATPFVNYTDEVVMFTNNQSLVRSFMTKFDDLWTSTTEFGWWANPLPSLTRAYPTSVQDPQLNFPPDQSYRNRSLAAYAKETQRIDVQMFRITDERQSDGVIAAVNRGVPVRLITDETEYRNADRLWDAYNVDKMFQAGVQVRLDAHQGIDHEKAILLAGTGTMIIGSSNWTSPSSDSQREHNIFSTQPWMVTWLTNQFERKWNNTTGNTETKPFVPLPPTIPTYSTPANAAASMPTSGVVLKWNGGLWAHIYDIYFGTTPNPPLLAADQRLGPSQSATDFRTYALPVLQPGTTYFWKIVSKTMAFKTANGPVWSFTTAGTPPNEPPPSTTLPAGWSNSDIGATGTTGTSSFATSTFTVTGGGADVWGTADALQYAFRTMTGDGSISARVATVQNVNAWTKAGVMIRNSLNPGAAQGFMLVSPSKGLAFQRRLANGSTSVSTAGSLNTAPRWVRLTRAGNTITAAESADGSSWTTVGSDTFTLTATVDIGLAISSHVAGANATATFDNVTVSAASGSNAAPTVTLTSPTNGSTFTAPATVALAATAGDSDGTVTKVDFFAGTTLIGSDTTSPYSFSWTNVAAGTYSVTAVATDNAGATTQSAAASITVNSPGTQGTLPAGWSDSDVGATGAAGSAGFAGSTFTVRGAGADVWGTADALHYAFRTLSGDGTIVARVATVQNVNAWTKAGVMIRNSLTPGAAQAFMLVSPGKGVAFQRRASDGNVSTSSAGTLTTAPRWVRLIRTGSTITGYESPDGVTWTQVGSTTFTMGATIDIGLGVSSHVSGSLATATFDNVTVSSSTSASNASPSVTVTSPANGTTFTEPATIAVAASATDSDGTVTKVDFFSGATLIGSATGEPFSISWNNVAAGTYNLTAVATDNGGATATSAAVAITVTAATPPGNSAPSVGITSPAAGATFTAPATITVNADAADTDGSIAKVDFFAGTTPIGTSTTSPYTVTWNDVAAGTYSLTAVATDDGGATTTSSAVSITVDAQPAPQNTLPAGWLSTDVGSVPVAGSAGFASGTYTVTGSGADIWGSADAFHYAYTSLSGNGTIIARVASIQNVDRWVKAGVMIRESLSAGSPHALMLVSSAKGLAFQRRVAPGGVTTNTAGTLSTAPRWVRLTRAGDTFSAYESADGSTWTLVGTETIPMSANVFVGLAVTSHTSASAATCTFTGVSIQ